MKRVWILLVLVILLTACSSEFSDNEGGLALAPANFEKSSIQNFFDRESKDTEESSLLLDDKFERLTIESGERYFSPFPTKSTQSDTILKEYGIIDSGEANLAGFYLLEGPLTEITPEIQEIADSIPEGDTDRETVNNIWDWTHSGLSCSQTTAESIREEVGRYSRTAIDIIESSAATGCTDWTHAFVTIARAKGIPATTLETVSDKWVSEMVINDEWNGEVFGHYYSEVYLEDEEVWDIFDPTQGWFTAVTEEGYVLGPIPWDDTKDYYADDNGVAGAYYIVFERALDSSDYGIESEAEFEEAIKERYYIQD